MELEDPKDLRARFRKFLILTKERKKMSKTTIRKRISLTVVTALTTGALSVIATAPVANAHLTTISTTATNTTADDGLDNNSMFVAVKLSTSGLATTINGINSTGAEQGTSLGLLTKDATSGTAQSATMLTSGVLSLYSPITATAISYVATGGTFNVSNPSVIGSTATYSQDRRNILFAAPGAATAIGFAWTAPSTAGTYTISMYYGSTGAVSLTSPTGTLGAQLTVTTVAASAGGSYSAAYSVCSSSNAGGNFTLASSVDVASSTTNGNSMWVNFALNDAYNNDLPLGNIVATATNGALLSYQDGATAAAGTASTVVAYDRGSADAIRVTQGTADAPLSTTVTITYNGTTVCTKTVGFAGAPTKLAVTVSETQKLNGSDGKADFLEDGYARAGLFTVLATDAAGNQVATSAIGTFSANAASLAGQTIVSALSVTSSATQTSTTLPGRVSTGTYTCGATAGEVKTAKLDFTITATGKVITSDAFTIRCADKPHSYTASFDKATYVQGEIATLTVKFLDSKGNAANSIDTTGTWTSVTPMLTNVSATGAAAGLGTTGSKTYTYTVGTASGMTAGTYTSIIDFGTLTGAGTAVKATPTYKLTTGGDTTTNADVLKSIVALIASINKQIQALQKLILKR
jgi:hypothetical protein